MCRSDCSSNCMNVINFNKDKQCNCCKNYTCKQCLIVCNGCNKSFCSENEKIVV